MQIVPKGHRGALLLAAATALAVAPAAIAAAAEPNAVERANAAWLAAINAGDNARGRATFADDAAIIGPSGPIAVGRAAIDARSAALTQTPGFHVAFTPERSSIAADGRTGFVVGQSEIAIPTPDGGRKLVKQRLLTVWRKEASGEWKCILDVAMGASPS